MGDVPIEHADCLNEWFKKIYGSKVDLRIVRMMEESSWVLRAIAYYYNYIQRKSPWVHRAFFLYFELLSIINRRSVALGRGFYEELLREFRPHVIVSVHDALNRGYFPVAHAILGKDSVCCVTYCGEFSGGFGYSINWVEPTVDRYFSRTRTAGDYARKLGLPLHAGRIGGNLLSPRLKRERAFDRVAYRWRAFSISEEKFVLFLHRPYRLADIVRLIDEIPHIYLLVQPTNGELRTQLHDYVSAHPSRPIFVSSAKPDDWRETDTLIKASDATYGRASIQLCARLLELQCIPILNTEFGIMPQEELQIKYFRNNEATELCNSIDQLLALLQRWQKAPHSLDQLRDRLSKLIPEGHPAAMVKEIYELGERIA